LSKVYSQYTKMRLVNNNEIDLLLPYYGTIDVVKKNLSKRNGDSHIDIQKHEKEGSLVIIDGIKAQFNSELDVVSFITRLVKYA
jgi:hypothetical protein